MALAATVLISRHGQRPPYPLPHDTSAAGPSIWTARPLPSAADWGMTEEDFAHQMLTPNGKLQMQNMGAFMASQLAEPCKGQITFIADDSRRDVQSAEAFRSGLGCANDVAINVSVAIGGDSESPCTGPDEAVVSELFGGNAEALTELYRPQIQLLDEVTGCCKAEACAAYGLPAAPCRLEELPYTYNGKYYNGFYSGPLQVAAALSAAFMLQRLSGLTPAWGNVRARRPRRRPRLCPPRPRGPRRPSPASPPGALRVRGGGRRR